MKKTLSILLAVVLMFAMAIPVFAEDVSSADVSGETTKEVTAQRTDVAGEAPATVYYVTVEWEVGGDLKYTVNGATYEWKPENTAYEVKDNEKAEWSGAATVEITVTNKSNAAITATASWAQASSITESECKYGEGQNAITVASAATDTNIAKGDLAGEEKKDTINATVTVKEGSIAENGATVGTVTLSISK